MEGTSLHNPSPNATLIELQLTGSLRACADGCGDILPSLRKARALFVILAMTDGQSAPRRYLAGLLWSRNDPVQALARLRDTLRTLRQSIRDTLGDADVIQVHGDRVALRPGAVCVELDHADARENASMINGAEIAADLEGVDPALDGWLRTLRGRYRAAAWVAARPPGAQSFKRGTVIGVSVIHAIGPHADDYLPRALSEEIAAALSRIRGLVVVSTGSVASALAAHRNISADLGLDFLLEGSLQQVHGRIRIAIKLVDATNGAVCWTAQFDYDQTDLFHVQQDVAALVSAGLEPELPTIAAAQIKRIGGAADGAYELLLRAIGRMHMFDRRSFMEVGELLNRAIDLDPDYSPAYSWLSLWHIFLVGQGWAANTRASIARAGEVAEHAVMLDPNDARGLTLAGHVRAYLHRRLDQAIPLHERALSINPNLPLAWALSGVAHIYRGDLAEARYRIEQCRRLAPRDPHNFFADVAPIMVELLSHNHEQAAALGQLVVQLHPRFSAAYKPYLSALGHLGLEKEAALVYHRLLQLEPEFSIRAFRATSRFTLREHNEHYAAGLNLAGVT